VIALEAKLKLEVELVLVLELEPELELVLRVLMVWTVWLMGIRPLGQVLLCQVRMSRGLEKQG
jgi:hypothetical protein